MTDVADVILGRRFAPDPTAPDRQRWWDGWRWTARVRLPDGSEGLSWLPGLADLAAPVALDAPTEPALTFRPVQANDPIVAEPPSPESPTPESPTSESPTSESPTPEPPTPERMVAALGDDGRAFVPEASVPGAKRRRIVMAVGAAATAALITSAAAAGAGVFTSSDQRPHLAPQLAYRDVDAGFSLRYPDDWRLLRKDRGSAIRFAVAAPGATTTETNTVSVVVGTMPADLPALHTLADRLTEMLRQELPGVELEAAARSRVAEAPGFRFDFRDGASTPATRVQQYVGRSASGRPLTVTVTVREPRTAPTQTELSEFLDSLRTGDLRSRA